MPTIKQYAQNRLKEFNLSRPKLYEDSFWREIDNSKDIDKQFEYAENFISGCEQEGNAKRLPDYEEQNLVVYKAYKAIEKSVRCMSEISVVNSEFDAITKEQFDSWCEKLQDLIKRNNEQVSRYASRPDM